MINSNDRCRNWAFILYPDSAPSNYIDILRSLMVQACISPLHAPADDLKSHYHAVLLFGSVKSYEQVLSITKLFNGTFPIPVHDIRQYVRYLIHADNPEKEQFSGMEQIQTFGGLDVGKYFSMSQINKRDIFREIMGFIKDNPFIMYCDLIDYCLTERLDWLELLQSNLAVNKVITEYLWSWQKKNGRRPYDEMTRRGIESNEETRRGSE